MSDGKFVFNKQTMNYLAEVMKNSELSEVEFRCNDVYIRLAKNAVQSNVIASPAQIPHPQPHHSTENSPTTSMKNEEHNEEYLTAPVVGKIYVSPQPDSPPFIRVGDTIEKGQTIFVIEAMKVMNNVKATKTGVVSKILINNGEPVEYGQPLVLLK